MKKETREKLYKISEVAEILGVHEDTLRNWEREGFVVPERIGTRGDRRYTAEMIGKIREQGLVSDLAKKSPANKKDLAEYTKDELIKELQLLKKQKKYGLVWENHIEEVIERCKTEAPILVAKKDKQIKDTDKNKPTNILIEGDNYHALQVLNYTHKDKIDVIYIDPPYNTGNKDFIYNDSYVDKEDNFRHSKWLSFTEKRLVLAKKLLKEDGVIFMSIDDNEQAQLKILCNGIFGEENFISNFIWNQKITGGHDSTYINTVHEYVLCYAKDKSYLSLNKDISESSYKLFDENSNQFFKWDSLWTVSHGYTPNCDYPILSEDGTEIYPWMCHKDKENVRNIARWFWSKETYNKQKDELLIKKDKAGDFKVYKKVFATGEKPFQSIFSREDVGGTSTGKFALEQIFGKIKQFDNPKSVLLIKKILQIASNKKSIILDFMAGSGTTGHAVLDLNKEDGGNRKFILCTNNELNGLEKELREKGLSEEEIEEHGICRRITHKRIEKVIKGYTKPNGEKVKGLGGNLEYFKTEFVDVENVDKVSDKKKLEFTYEAGQMIALKEDAFKEVVKNKFYQIFTDEKDKFVGIYFRENLDKLSEMEKKILDKKDVKLYLFSYGVNDFKKDYSEYKNVAVKDIPEPILKIYKSLNN